MASRHPRETILGSGRLDTLPPGEAMIGSPPENMAPSERTSIELAIVGLRDLAREQRVVFTVGGLSTRAINACMFLNAGRDRESWIPAEEMYETWYHPERLGVTANTLMRGVDILDRLRYLTDGVPIVERNHRGSGSKPSYRIHPAIGFTDLRSAEALRLFYDLDMSPTLLAQESLEVRKTAS